jgi:hypothetical protein
VALTWINAGESFCIHWEEGKVHRRWINANLIGDKAQHIE